MLFATKTSLTTERRRAEPRFKLKSCRCDAAFFSRTLIKLNVIFALIGLGAIVTGIVLNTTGWPFLTLSRAANQKFDTDPIRIPSLLEDAEVILIAGGVMMVVSAVLGIVSTIKKARKLLYAYAIILVASGMLQFGAGVLCTLHKDRFAKFAKAFMEVSLKVRYRGPFYHNITHFDGDLEYSQAVDYGQAKLQCCGVNNGSDYTSFSQWNRTWEHQRSVWKARVPFTCCRLTNLDVLQLDDLLTLVPSLTDPACPLFPTSENSFISVGCFDRLLEIYEVMIIIIITVGSVMVGLEMLAWILAFRLARSLQRNFSDFEVW